MFRLLAVVCAIAIPNAAAYGQSICNQQDVVFVGRAEGPITFRISGEAEIERARQNLIRVEDEVAKLRASLDFKTNMERNVEFAMRLIKAKEELDMRRAMYPPPYDLTLTPVHVVQTFRGVSEPTLMVLMRQGSPAMQPGEQYLIIGARSRNLIPPFPEMSDLGHVADYVETQRVTHVRSSQQDLQFLASTISGATILGTLRMHSYVGELGPPVRGVRILVSSGSQVVETTTREDGSFAVFGVPSGRLEIKPALAQDLTIVDPSKSTVDIREGGCTTVDLRAALNGRVRGRIVGAAGVPLENVKLLLRIPSRDGRLPSPHSAQVGTSARADGTFEFLGVPPGTYLLTAWFQPVDGGKTRMMTYFPGTANEDAATPIVVGKATLHDGFDFVLRTE